MVLIQQNPELPIVPMTAGELGGDDFAYWMGSWGNAAIDEVYHEDERIYFKSQDEDELEEQIFNRLESYNPAWSDTYLQEKTTEEYETIKWKKVITVKIELP